jgi:hypothetical protein
MAIFTITAHIELPSRTEPIKSTPIRLQIPASSELEAKAKAERFIEQKLSIVFDSCLVQPPSQARPTPDETWADIMRQFGEVFGKKP